MTIEAGFGSFPIGFRYGDPAVLVWVSADRIAVGHGPFVSYLSGTTLDEERRVRIGDEHVTSVSYGGGVLLVSTEAGTLIALDPETLAEKSRVVIDGACWARLGADGTTAAVLRSGKHGGIDLYSVERFRVADGASLGVLGGATGSTRPAHVSIPVSISPTLTAALSMQWDGLRVVSTSSVLGIATEVTTHACLSDEAALVGTMSGAVRQVSLCVSPAEIAWETPVGPSRLRGIQATEARVAAATDEGHVALLSRDGKSIHSWKVPKGVGASLPSPDGERVLLSSSAGGDVLAPTRLSLLSPSKPKALVTTHTPLGHATALSLIGAALFVGTEDGDVVRIDAAGLSRAAPKNGPVRGLRATPDGNYLVVAGKQLLFADPSTLATTRQVKVAGLGGASRAEALRLVFDDGAARLAFVTDRRASALESSSGAVGAKLDAVDEDRELVAAGLSGGELLAIDERGTILRRKSSVDVLAAAPGRVRCAAFTPDGGRVALGVTDDGTSRLIVADTVKGEILAQGTLEGLVSVLAWTSGAEVLAAASDRAMEIRAAKDLGPIAVAARPAGYPYDLVFSPNGTVLWLVSHIALDAPLGDIAPGALRAYDAGSGEPLATVLVAEGGRAAVAIVGDRAEVLGDAKVGKRLVVEVSGTAVRPFTSEATGLFERLLGSGA